MDVEMITKLADSAAERAHGFHAKYEKAKAALNRYRAANGIFAEGTGAMSQEAAGYLNDYFYWIGHAVAYRGIVAGLEIGKMVEEEMEAEGSCP